jgi:hypothetical protein
MRKPYKKNTNTNVWPTLTDENPKNKNHPETGWPFWIISK